MKLQGSTLDHLIAYLTTHRNCNGNMAITCRNAKGEALEIKCFLSALPRGQKRNFHVVFEVVSTPATELPYCEHCCTYVDEATNPVHDDNICHECHVAIAQIAQDRIEDMGEAKRECQS